MKKYKTVEPEISEISIEEKLANILKITKALHLADKHGIIQNVHFTDEKTMLVNLSYHVDYDKNYEINFDIKDGLQKYYNDIFAENVEERIRLIQEEKARKDLRDRLVKESDELLSKHFSQEQIKIIKGK